MMGILPQNSPATQKLPIGSTSNLPVPRHEAGDTDQAGQDKESHDAAAGGLTIQS